MRGDRRAVTAREQASSPASLRVRALAATIYRRVVVMERRLDHTLPEVAARMPTRFALLTLGDLEPYARLRPDAEAAAARQRLVQGHQCFAIWHEGQIEHAGEALRQSSLIGRPPARLCI